MLQKLRKKYARHWQLYVFLAIPVIYILLFHYYPMLGLQIAFKKFSFKGGIWGSKWVGLYQFKKFFKAYQFKQVLTNTLILSFYSIAASFPFPVLFALTLNVIQRPKFKKIAQTITYMPHFISVVVLVGMILLAQKGRLCQNKKNRWRKSSRKLMICSAAISAMEIE